MANWSLIKNNPGKMSGAQNMDISLIWMPAVPVPCNKRIAVAVLLPWDKCLCLFEILMLIIGRVFLTRLMFRRFKKTLYNIWLCSENYTIPLRYDSFTTALRAWYSSPYASNFTSFVFSLAHYQRVSLKICWQIIFLLLYDCKIEHGKRFYESND